MIEFMKKNRDTLDRRTPENFYLSILIDIGVTYERALGMDHAEMFCRKHEIPHALLTRILAPDAQRRLTDWEQCALRAELQRRLSTDHDTEKWPAENIEPAQRRKLADKVE